ncbi:hypothetical protein Tco_1362618 [Tanacetum coccineum]
MASSGSSDITNSSKGSRGWRSRGILYLKIKSFRSSWVSQEWSGVTTRTPEKLLGDKGLSSGGTKLNSIFITVEVVPFEEQSDDLKKKLAKTNEAKMVLYNAFPKKEYERLFMCITAKDIWQSLLITHQGNSQVKDNKIDLFVQQCKQFTILEEESIGSNFARFNTIITSLKALDEGVSSKNYVRKFIRAVHPKWIAKVTAIEESKDLSSQALDKLIDQQIRRIHQLDTTYRPFHSERRIYLYSLNGVYVLPNNTAYSVRCMTRSSPKELITPFENPKSAFRSKRRLYETPEEETTEIMTETMEQYMSKTRGNYGIKYCFEFFPCLFRAWERFKERLMECPQHYLTDMQEVILFYNGLDVPTRQILDSKGAIPTKTAADAKIAIQEMAEYSQKWHNGTSSKAKSTETSDGLAAIQAQLNNLGREIKKVNEKVYAAQVGCELCKGPHYTKDCPLKEEGNTLEEAYYTQFGAPYQPAGQYRAVGPGFYQRNNGNSSYPDRRQTLEESLTKFMAESAKRHEENSNIIKEI